MGPMSGDKKSGSQEWAERSNARAGARATAATLGAKAPIPLAARRRQAAERESRAFGALVIICAVITILLLAAIVDVVVFRAGATLVPGHREPAGQQPMNGSGDGRGGSGRSVGAEGKGSSQRGDLGTIAPSSAGSGQSMGTDADALGHSADPSAVTGRPSAAIALAGDPSAVLGMLRAPGDGRSSNDSATEGDALAGDGNGARAADDSSTAPGSVAGRSLGAAVRDGAVGHRSGQRAWAERSGTQLGVPKLAQGLVGLSIDKTSVVMPKMPTAELATPAGTGAILEDAVQVGEQGLDGDDVNVQPHGISPGALRPHTHPFRVLQGHVTVVDALPRSVIEKVIRAHQSEIKYCYDTELQKNPKLAGKVAAAWVIGPNGSVETASVAETLLNNDSMEQCMIDRIKHWRFPEPRGGGEVRVTYPWIFKPAAEDPE